MLDLLSNKIIQRIIRYAYVYVPKPQVVDHSRCFQLPPVVASHVCRSWRNALLSDPDMWTCIIIPQMNPDIIKEMLHRSASATLDVFIDTSRHDYASMVSAHLPNALSLLFKHIRRFETLHIKFLHTDVDPVALLVEQVFPYLSRPAPLLQSFLLYTEKAWLFEDESFVQTLFSGCAPNLKYIRRSILTGFHEVLRSPLFQNLSGLTLVANDELYLDQLLNVLDLSPELEIFEVRVPRIRFLVPSRSSNRRVNLSNLKTLLLGITYDTWFLDLFVEHVTFPLINKCQITCEQLPYEDWSSAPSLRIFIRRYPIQRLILGSTKEGATVVFVSPFLKWPSRFQYMCSNASEHMGSLLNLLYACDLSYITQFTMDPDISLNSKMLRTLLASMVNLGFLDITRARLSGRLSPSLSVLTALIPLCVIQEADTDWESNSSSTGQTFRHGYIFPCAFLRKLTIDVVNANEEYYPEQSKLGADYASMLRVCSDTRREHGYPLEKIIVRCAVNCLTDEAVAILEPQEGFPITLEEGYYPPFL